MCILNVWIQQHDAIILSMFDLLKPFSKENETEIERWDVHLIK